MEDLIKIASNGQWTLEKAKKNNPEVERMIAEFMAQKKGRTGAATPASVSPTMRQNSTAGLRTAQQNTGANPTYSKEQVAAIRAGIPEETVAKMPGTPSAPQMSAQQKHVQRVMTGIERKQSEADQQAKTSQGRKAAWEAGVAFLAQHGNKGYQALHAQMQQRKALDTAHESGTLPEGVKPRPLPPQAPSVDANGNRVVGERQGTFHGEGAVTTGKIKNKGIGYPDKETGEMRYTSTPQVEKHHWSWDHNKKKWNHVKTTFENPTIR